MSYSEACRHCGLHVVPLEGWRLRGDLMTWGHWQTGKVTCPESPDAFHGVAGEPWPVAPRAARPVRQLVSGATRRKDPQWTPRSPDSPGRVPAAAKLADLDRQAEINRRWTHQSVIDRWQAEYQRRKGG